MGAAEALLDVPAPDVPGRDKSTVVLVKPLLDDSIGEGMFVGAFLLAILAFLVTSTVDFSDPVERVLLEPARGPTGRKREWMASMCPSFSSIDLNPN